MKDSILFVGIDVSKDKHDICIKNSNGNELTRRFQILNTKTDLNVLYATIDKLTKTKGIRDVIFGMEATGIYYLPLLSATIICHYYLPLLSATIICHYYLPLNVMDIPSGCIIPSKRMATGKWKFERRKQIQLMLPSLPTCLGTLSHLLQMVSRI